jgi:hypothetical protein
MANYLSLKNPRKGSPAPLESGKKAKSERGCETISGSVSDKFKNDPDDPTNPNEAVERSRKKLRPKK